MVGGGGGGVSMCMRSDCYRTIVRSDNVDISNILFL